MTEDLTDVGEKRLSRLPEVRFQWLPAPLFGLPLRGGRANTSAVYFERSARRQRRPIRPSSRPPSPARAVFPWLTSTTSVGLRETAYTAAAQPGATRIASWWTLGQRFGSTFLRRFEAPGFGFARLTHVVDSSVQYQYVPWVDQQSLLQFDSVDFVSPQNRLTFRLTNRLMGRSETADGGVRTYEVASLTVAQSLNLQPTTREFSNLYLEALTPERVDQAVKDLQPLTNGFTRATERRLSNLVFQAAIRPLPALGLYGTVAVNVERIGVEGVNSGVEAASVGRSHAGRWVKPTSGTGKWMASWPRSCGRRPRISPSTCCTRYDIRSTTLLGEYGQCPLRHLLLGSGSEVHASNPGARAVR